MNLKKHGKNILNHEISSINSNGIWFILDEKEYFISFLDYPSFQKASLEDIFSFEFSYPDHIYWKNLDIDIELDSLTNPERFPLEYS
ncbi:MAG: DUF2442 domain-containing protein [Candidatus Muirbacterium halophilum]|nr:DUF2442 domain-containing protein [Candidatus Muirbacterium halophilum]MCK9477420.1 DUF2442 domain-containing protein [Candidatus Muirbacterium halophilum]